MKRRLSWLPGSVLLFLPVTCVFAAPSVEWVGLEDHVQTPSISLPAVFGDREQKAEIEIDGAPAVTGSLHADMFQISGTLAMPVGKDVSLQDTLVLTGAPSQRTQISVKFPHVEKQAEILLRLSLVPGTPGAKPFPLGELRFAVFSADVTKELTDLLQPKPDAKIIVFGPGHALRHALEGWHVSFEEGGMGTPDRFDPTRFYFGDLAAHAQYQQAEDRSEGARIVLFAPDDSLPSGVYSDRTNAGAHVQVTSPLLDNLANDPRAQLAFIKIFHFLSASPPSTN